MCPPNPVREPAEASDFASLEARLEPGLALPAPTGVFPRLEVPADT
jgi:methionyl-tRNA synthetase